MTVRGGVGDILSAVCPFDFVAVILHEPNEMFPVPGLCHAFVNGDLQIHLPAIALGIGTVLPVGHGSLLPLLLGLHNRKTVLHTQLVRCTAQCHEAFLVAVVLEPSFIAYRVDHEMGVDMFPVRVRSNEDLIAGDLFRQL